MKGLITYIISAAVFVIGLVLSYNISGVERIFFIGGAIVVALLVALLARKIMEEFTNNK